MDAFLMFSLGARDLLMLGLNAATEIDNRRKRRRLARIQRVRRDLAEITNLWWA